MSKPWPFNPEVDEVTSVYLTSAMDAFEEISRSIEINDLNAANERTHRYVHLFDDTDSNPFEHLARVGFVFNASLIRELGGDEHPNEPPTQQVDSFAILIMDPETGNFIDRPIEEFAMQMVMLAVNWDWKTLDDSMLERCELATREGDERFLINVCRALMEMYVGLSGPGIKTWHERK